jgi:hypothetical protein
LLLRDTFANRLNITGISGSEPFDPCLDARSRLKVVQGIEPLHEKVCFANFHHEANVAARLHIVNAMDAVLRDWVVMPIIGLKRSTESASGCDEQVWGRAR